MTGLESASDRGEKNIFTFIQIKFWIVALSLGILAGMAEAIIKWIRLILNVPDPMGHEILWVAPLFYGLVSLLMGFCLTFGIWIIQKLIPRLRLDADFILSGFIVLITFLGTLNALFLVVSTATWAALILAAGMTYQVIAFLRKRKGGAAAFILRLTPGLAGFLVLIPILTVGGKLLSEKIQYAQLPPPPEEAPNVILITLDTLRADHLGVSGYARSTPNLDQFANENINFTMAIAPASWTVPSHASIMTGLLPRQHQAMVSSGGILQDQYFTLAEAFAENGYATAAFIANEYACAGNLGFKQGFAHYSDLFWNVEDAIRWTVLGEKLRFRILSNPQLNWYDMGRKNADDINGELFSWLAKRPQRPFFVWLNYFDPHDPYSAPVPFDTKYGEKPALGDPGSFGLVGASDWQGTLSAQETAWQVDAYDAAIAYLDDRMGILFDQLKQQSLYDNSIIIITSDHGEAFGEHELYGHANSLYREVLEVPLFIRDPELSQEPERITRPVSLRNLAVTIVEMAQLQQSNKFPGSSLFSPDNNEPILSEVSQNPYHPASHPVAHGDLLSIFEDQWHMILTTKDQKQIDIKLFRQDDRREQRDLAATQMGKELSSKFIKQLEEILTSDLSLTFYVDQ
jgi:arylsulfatase A-like enzyme